MGYKIKELRVKKNLSQEELSVESGVSRATISALEDGSSPSTTTKTLMKIARALGVPVEELLFTQNV